MKRILLAAVIATGIGMASSAQAADLKPAYKAPPAPPAPVIYNWTGFYIGGFAGAAWGGDTTVHDRDWWYAARPSWSHDMGTSFIGGGTIGYNWQAPGSQWVFGIEGELGWLDLNGDSRWFTMLGRSDHGSWYGFIGGRIGYAWDRTLFYVKGGAAFLKADFEVHDAGEGWWLRTNGGKTHSTWALGGGVEYAFAPNWSIKAEYLFLGLNKTHTTCGIGSWDYGEGGSGSDTFCFDHNTDGIHTLKVGLNYKFDWGKAPAPVVARY